MLKHILASTALLAALTVPSAARAATLNIGFNGSWTPECTVRINYYDGDKGEVTSQVDISRWKVSGGVGSMTISSSEIRHLGDSDSRVELRLVDHYIHGTVQDCIDAGGVEITKVWSSTSGNDFKVKRWLSDGSSGMDECVEDLDYFANYSSSHKAYSTVELGVADPSTGEVLWRFSSKVAKTSESGSSTQKAKECGYLEEE